MSYLVMECHRAYAVVLSSDGRFLKVANVHYEVGQLVTHVIEIEPSAAGGGKRVRYWPKLLSVAACLCLVVWGAWQLLLFPYGTVRMQINPDVQITVNRMDYVIDLDGLNQDGEKLLADISSFGKKLNSMADELADKAMHMGYLEEGGSITLLVSGRNQKWANTTETELRQELYSYLHEQVEILTDASREDAEQPKQNDTRVVIPIDPAVGESAYGNDGERTNNDRTSLPTENNNDSDHGVPEPTDGDSDYGAPAPTDGGSDYGVPASTDSDSDYGTPGPTDEDSDNEAPTPTDGDSDYGAPTPTDGDSDYDSVEDGDSEYNE